MRGVCKERLEPTTAFILVATGGGGRGSLFYKQIHKGDR